MVETDKTSEQHDDAPAVMPTDRRLPALSLSTQLLLLTAAFVMLAQILIFVPSIANFRTNWLMERLASAQIASLAAEAAPGNTVSDALRRELLETAGVRGVALRRDEFRQLVLAVDTTRAVDEHYDLRNANWATRLADGMALFFAPDNRLIRVFGAPEKSAGDLIEIVMDEAPLKRAMYGFALNILGLSIVISLIAAALVYLSLNALFVRPMKRLTRNMIHFRENPEDRGRVVEVSGRRDELGMAERELSVMQTGLADMLRQQSRLAALGLAVSKINHDLRNMLSSAQIISDRLTALPDPTVQKFAPRLIASLDRAIQLCAETLNFGQAAEIRLERERFPLGPLINEVAESLDLSDKPQISLQLDVNERLDIDADRDQLFRVISNLMRNSLQALEGRRANGHLPTVTVRGWRDGGVVYVEVRDNGPGLPMKARENLFKPFMGTARSGGTGLGLVIAHEVVSGHNGDLLLIEDSTETVFRFSIPDRVALNGASARNGAVNTLQQGAAAVATREQGQPARKEPSSVQVQ